MSNENYIEELKGQLVNSISSRRDFAREKLDNGLDSLKAEYEKRRFELQDVYVDEITELNQYENYIQMGDFFALSDVTNALSQMISNAEGEKYVSHKTQVSTDDGTIRTIVSFIKEGSEEWIDDVISSRYIADPESVKGADSSYIYLTEYEDQQLDIRSYFYGITRYEDSEIFVTFNPHNTYLDSKHVKARIYDPHFDYVNSFMDNATKNKILYGFEKSDDFAQMAIVHGDSIYRKNNPNEKKGRIKKFFEKK